MRGKGQICYHKREKQRKTIDEKICLSFCRNESMSRRAGSVKHEIKTIETRPKTQAPTSLLLAKRKSERVSKRNEAQRANRAIYKSVELSSSLREEEG